MPLWNPYAGTAAIAAHAALPIVHQDAPGLIAAKINSGSFTGDGTDHRAIAHGLGVVPKLVLIAHVGGIIFGCVSGARQMDCMIDANDVETIWDATNFYVSYESISFNQSSLVFNWVAFG